LSVSRLCARSGSFARYVLTAREVNALESLATFVADRAILDERPRVGPEEASTST
jgi:hypothetical protein